MKIIKLNIENKDFSNYSVQEWQDYFEKFFNNASLHSILASTLTQPYLCEVREGIETSTGNFKKTWDKKPKFPYFNDIDWASLSDEKKFGEIFNSVHTHYEWMESNIGIYAHSFEDLTMIRSTISDGNFQYDLYETSEVLKVIDQWIEYLEKFNAEK